MALSVGNPIVSSAKAETDMVADKANVATAPAAALSPLPESPLPKSPLLLIRKTLIFTAADANASVRPIPETYNAPESLISESGAHSDL
jgi:hypothetical protein